LQNTVVWENVGRVNTRVLTEALGISGQCWYIYF